MTPRLKTVGLAGRIAGTFLHSRLTPLTIVASVLLGALALATLPREEEPQIKVPMVDVQIAWPGTPVAQVERQLTTPVERQLWQIPDLEYLYSISREDGAALILRFKVGFDPDQALTRVRTRLDEAAAGSARDDGGATRHRRRPGARAHVVESRLVDGPGRLAPRRGRAGGRAAQGAGRRARSIAGR